MILIRSPSFRTCYHGLSFPKHVAYARQAGLEVSVFESFRAGCDIDEPEDLAEVLLHGRGRSKTFLEDIGFVLSENGRAGPESPRRHREVHFHLTHAPTSSVHSKIIPAVWVLSGSNS